MKTPICLFFFILVCAQIAQSKESKYSSKDSLKALLKVETDKYPLDSKELFTDGVGLKGLVDSVYPNLNGISKFETVQSLKYPLVLNERFLVERINKNKNSLAKKGTPEWQKEAVDSTASDDRFLSIQLMDGRKILGVCDTIFQMLEAEIWKGHIQGFPVGSIYIDMRKKIMGGMSIMINIEGVGKAYQMVSSIEDSKLLVFREQNYALMPENECGIR